MHGHRLAELRSIALHRAIAVRVRGDPSLVDAARAKLDVRDRSGRLDPATAAAWRAMLALPLHDLANRIEALGDRREETTTDCRLRQATPFAGVLTPEERWRILADVNAAFRADGSDESGLP